MSVLSSNSVSASSQLPPLLIDTKKDDLIARANKTSDRLTSLNQDLFTQIVNQYLPQSVTASIQRLNCTAYLKIHSAGTQLRQLKFEMRGKDLKNLSENFAMIFNRYPGVNDLDLTMRGCHNSYYSYKLFQSLARAVKERPMNSLKIEGDCEDRSGGSATTDAVGELIENLDFEKLEHLDLNIQSGIESIFDHPSTFSRLLSKLSDCQELRTFVISLPWQPEYYMLRVKYNDKIEALITALPQTVQNLGSYMVNSKNADVIMQRLNQAPIQKCDLEFNRHEITPEKLKAFLEFLHLDQMTEIRLCGSAITGEIVDYIAEQLKKNTTLRSLELANMGNVSDAQITNLIEAIGSQELRSIKLYVYMQPNDALLKILKDKFKVWDQLVEWKIGQLDQSIRKEQTCQV